MKEIEKKLDKSKYFAFDTETTSLLAHEAELVGFSFALQAHEGFYIPIRHNEQTELNPEEVTNWLKEVLERNENKIIGQNLKYDISVLQKYDIKIKKFCADTMLMSYAINSFLDNIIVNAEEDALRINRKLLLAECKDILSSFFNFSILQIDD